MGPAFLVRRVKRSRPIAHGMWGKAGGLVLEGSLPDTAAVDLRLKLLMFIAAPVAFSTWSESRDCRFVVRDVGSGRSDLTGSIEAA